MSQIYDKTDGGDNGLNSGMTTLLLLGHGVYTIPEAARLTGLRIGRVREWFRGRSAPSDRRKPIFHGDYEVIGGDTAISFHDLIDVFVVGQLRNHGVSLQIVHKVFGRLQKDLDSSHPFCHQQLLTDGKTVLTHGLDAEGQEEIIEVLSGQRVFADLIRPFLQKIDYDAQSLARRWRIANNVVLDPTIQFGRPVVAGVSIATAVLAAAYQANDHDADLVADWYNVDPENVRAAVSFESKLAA